MQGYTAADVCARERSERLARVDAWLAALAAALLGTLVIWTVGFSQIDVVHNAAHDTRHSNAFPCH
jgi:cobalt transporter subunit CbtB